MSLNFIYKKFKPWIWTVGPVLLLSAGSSYFEKQQFISQNEENLTNESQVVLMYTPSKEECMEVKLITDESRVQNTTTKPTLEEKIK
jgi:hypothetical protein